VTVCRSLQASSKKDAAQNRNEQTLREQLRRMAWMSWTSGLPMSREADFENFQQVQWK
jgi:hypothetical protein